MASPPKAPAADPIDARLVRRLADILTETGLSEIEVEHSGLKIRVAKVLTGGPTQLTYAPAPAPAAAAPPPAPAARAPPRRAPRACRSGRTRGARPRRRRRGEVADGGQRLPAA